MQQRGGARVWLGVRNPGRKARLARAVARPAFDRKDRAASLETAAAPAAALISPAEPVVSTETQTNKDPQPAFERAPRMALGIGTAAIAAIMLLLPATRPQWLTLLLAPQTRVADVVPGSALTPRDPFAVTRESGGEAASRSTAQATPQAAAAPASPASIADAKLGDQPGTIEPAGGPQLASAGPGDPAPARAPVETSGQAVNEAIHAVPATGAISALAAYDAGDSVRAERMARCEVDFFNDGGAVGPIAPLARDAFGKALAEAALQQTRGFGVYTDSYRKIAFPMGDVPALFGVCTDVVIRAYRALGVDLQARVHAARVGALDPSIAHRRTYTLRRYFASRGASLPVSDFAEDYLPGDIVTYYRPQNSGSKDHIAIVADRTGPSGRPMIIHNRGWGAQIEDALFVDKITGHYRYTGAEAPLSKIKSAALKMQAKTDAASPEAKRFSRNKAARIVLKARSERRNKTLKQ